MNEELKAFLSGGFKNFFGANDEWTNQVWEGIQDDPWRLLTGFDPLNTHISNALLGRNDDPLGGWLGGPTQDQMNAVDPDGTPRYEGDEKNAAQAANVIIPLVVATILTAGAAGGAAAGAEGGAGAAGGAGGLEGGIGMGAGAAGGGSGAGGGGAAAGGGGASSGNWFTNYWNNLDWQDPRTYYDMYSNAQSLQGMMGGTGGMDGMGGYGYSPYTTGPRGETELEKQERRHREELIKQAYRLAAELEAKKKQEANRSMYA